MSTTDALTQIDKALEAFVSYQQAADWSFLAAEEARERQEEQMGGEKKEGRPEVSAEIGAGTSKIESTCLQQFNFRSYLRQFQLV